MRIGEKPLIAAAAVQQRVAELAEAVSRDYACKHAYGDGAEHPRGVGIVLVTVLKGGLPFAADLMRRLTIPVTLEFVRARSYKGVRSRGAVEFTHLPETSLAGKDVLLVEDILDTGVTAAAILDRLDAERPASLHLCTLLDKPARRQVDVRPRYVGFQIDNHFVVGYGLDYNEAYRELPDVYILHQD
ncbi:MAG TPA: hypoxanthine phosphoribosyltransferase [Candidatus Hydrogenedentes bacterium]|nr:hypoxanthine phosphoribosyltransferase [Candidatus Hydrogenedentota bacterium]